MLAVRLATLTTFFDTALPPAGRESKYADLALYHYLKFAVPTMRFAPHAARDFAGCWLHYYDKPLRLGDAAANGAASSGASVLAADVARAEAMLATLRNTLQQVEQAPPEVRASRAHEIDALVEAVGSLLQQEDAHLAAAAVATAAEAPPTPVLLLATQMRSVIELFCANFVGAPNLPPDAIVSEMAGTLLADNLQALGQSPLVVAILSVPFLPPLLEECSRLFGLPFTYCAPAPGGE